LHEGLADFSVVNMVPTIDVEPLAAIAPVEIAGGDGGDGVGGNRDARKRSWLESESELSTPRRHHSVASRLCFSSISWRRRASSRMRRRIESRSSMDPSKAMTRRFSWFALLSLTEVIE
jgi:hypothetical protein